VSHVTRKILCTFPQKLIKEPVLYNLGKKFEVVYNICGASITDKMGMVALDLEGKESEVERAVAHLEQVGVKVESRDGDSTADARPRARPADAGKPRASRA
jgi:ABC-type methionine transport system ATPase subunit